MYKICKDCNSLVAVIYVDSFGVTEGKSFYVAAVDELREDPSIFSRLMNECEYFGHHTDINSFLLRLWSHPGIWLDRQPGISIINDILKNRPLRIYPCKHSNIRTYTDGVTLNAVKAIFKPENHPGVQY